MWCLLANKFHSHSNLRAQLLTTNDLTLVEWNWWGDTFWGADTRELIGANVLGQMLMDIRTYYR